MADDKRATILRGDDGQIYFLREEVLEACKVTDPAVADECAALFDEGEVSGFSMTPAPQSLTFVGPFNPVGNVGGWAAEGTVMCPTVVRSAATGFTGGFNSSR